MDAGIRFSWWRNFKCPVAAQFSSFFYFPTVFPLNGGAGTPTGETAASLKTTGRVPNGAQMSRHIYLSPSLWSPLTHLNEGMFGECRDTARARPACVAGFNKRQLQRS